MAGTPTQERHRAGVVHLAPYVREHRGAFTVLIALSLLASATALVQPWAVTQVVDTGVAGRPVTGVVLVLVAVSVGDLVLAAVQQYLLQRTAHGLVLGVRERLLHKILRLPVREYDQRTMGDLVSRVGADTTAIHWAVTAGLVEAAAAGFMVVGAVVLAFLIDPLLVALTLGLMLTGIVGAFLLMRTVQDLARVEQDEFAQLTAATLRSLTAIRTIRACGATDRETDVVTGRARMTYAAGIHTAKLAAASLQPASAAFKAANIVVLCVGAFKVADGQLTLGQLVSFILYVNLIIGPFQVLVSSWSRLQQGLGAMQRIAEVEALPTEAQASPVVPSPAPRAEDEVLVALRGVSFEYTRGGGGLRDVSFDVRRGSTVALVGPSGAGKSTVLALIERFYEPGAGAIALEGTDVRALSHDELRSRIAYAEQDPAVLEGTLRSNVALAAPDVHDDVVREALAGVNLSGLEERSDDGLDVQVGERGTRLSGGEKQRLTIARALLPVRDLLLLDEPTAQLDPANEDQLRDAIRARDGRTVVVAAHRLSTVMDADQIVVMQDGAVVATGNHDELVASCPLYLSMAQAQRLA